MKKVLSVFFITLICSCCTISASAAEADENVTIEITSNVREVEIQQEINSAEAIMGGACHLETEEVQIVGDYVVETRLYVLDEAETATKSGVRYIGGVSSHTWTPRFTSGSWTVKVLLSANFAYNGSTAICDHSDYKFWAIHADNTPDKTGYDTYFGFKDGSTATVSCEYTRHVPGTNSDLEVYGIIKVTCTKDGQVGVETEVPHKYF